VSYLQVSLILLLLLLSSQRAWGQVTPDTVVSLVVRLYDDGFYERAELEARRALSADAALLSSTRTELEKYLAFTLVAEGRNQEAKQHFIQALNLTPDLILDPILVSPKIIAVFEEAKSEFKERQKKQIVPTSAVSSSVSWRVLVYPGWEQYYQGRVTKGVTLAALETALISATVVLDFKRASARDAYLNAIEPADIESKYTTYNSLRKAEIYIAAVAIFIWIYSELDAFLHLPPSLDPPGAVSYQTGFAPIGIQFRFHF